MTDDESLVTEKEFEAYMSEIRYIHRPTEADDIVARLREWGGDPTIWNSDPLQRIEDGVPQDMLHEAAAEIEQLREYVEELRSDRFEWVKTAQRQEEKIARLQAACQDFYHLTMCVESGCQRCTENK